MKKILVLITIFVSLFLFSSFPVFAQMGMMGNGSGDSTNLNKAVKDILTSQNITDIKKVDCTKVTNDQLEKLGDGWMDVQLGEGQAHEQMDDMMGGEGSESLTIMHQQMGRNYLGCENSFSGVFSWNNVMGGYNGMMGNYLTRPEINTVLIDAVLLSGLAFLISGTIFFLRGIKK